MSLSRKDVVNKRSYIFLFILVLLNFTISCSQKNQLTIIKQWHLSPNANTQDIEEAKKLPHYPNQIDIYHRLVEMIQNNETKLIIAEGCEGEVTKDFSKNYNGWSMDALEKLKDSSQFSSVLAPVHMKLKVKFPKLKILCGDNEELVKKNLMAFSELKGFLGFWEKLNSFKGVDQKKYLIYESKLKELFPEETIKDSMGFIVNKISENLNLFESYISQRNDSFIEVLKKNRVLNPVLIIGGLHVDELSYKLKNDSFKVNVITPKGYDSSESILIESLKANIAKMKEKSEQMVFNQMPEGFQIDQFPLSNLLSEMDLFTEKELVEIKGLISPKYFPYLLSDFDKDGVRDFTLSSSNGLIVISSEDTDWDNDGKENFLDSTVGTKEVAPKLRDIEYQNKYISNVEPLEVIESFQKKMNIHLLQEQGINHEILILEVFKSLADKKIIPIHGIKFIKAASPKISYGSNVFFSYINYTKTMEYYPNNLFNYIQNQFQNRFKDVTFKKYINSYVIPLIIHSLSHEIAHSLDFDINGLAVKNQWTFELTNYNGKYLKNFRHPLKIIADLKENIRFHGKNYKEWNDDYSAYQTWLNLYFKNSTDKERLKYLEKSKYFVNKKSKRFDQKISYFTANNIVSVYSTKNMSEWFAENYAMCIFQKIYPNSQTNLRSVELEHLLGINPRGTILNGENCLN